MKTSETILLVVAVGAVAVVAFMALRPKAAASAPTSGKTGKGFLGELTDALDLGMKLWGGASSTTTVSKNETFLNDDLAAPSFA